jgi:hypothetical protein
MQSSALCVGGGGGVGGVRPACQNIASADFHIQTFLKSTQIYSSTETNGRQLYPPKIIKACGKMGGTAALE